MKAVAHYTKIRTTYRISLLINVLFVAVNLPAQYLNIGDYGAKAKASLKVVKKEEKAVAELPSPEKCILKVEDLNMLIEK